MKIEDFNTAEIINYLKAIGFVVFTYDELDDHDDDIVEYNKTSLSSYSDEEIFDEAQDRGFNISDGTGDESKIAEMIRQKDSRWQDEAIKYFGEITGRIL